MLEEAYGIDPSEEKHTLKGKLSSQSSDAKDWDPKWPCKFDDTEPKRASR